MPPASCAVSWFAVCWCVTCRQVLLERLDMCLEEQGASGSAAQTPTAAAAPAGPRPGSACMATPTAAAAAAGSHATAAAASLSVAPAGKPSSRAPASAQLRPGSAPSVVRQPGTHRAPAAATSTAPGRPASGSSTSSNAAAGCSSCTPQGRSNSGCAKQPGGKSKARGLIEVSTSGGLGQSIMQQSAQSVLDELDVTLG